MDEEVVWLKTERRFAFLVTMNAFYSTVKYFVDGTEYLQEVENDDYELWSERAIDYEQE